MLFQVRRDHGPSLRSGEGVTFHSKMDVSLLVASAFFWVLGVGCLFEAKPKEGAQLFAIVAFGVAAVFLFFGGLVTEVNFRNNLRRMDVKWRFFSFDLISHSHPFTDILIGIRNSGLVNPSGRISYIQRTYYSADVGPSHYLLGYPESVPICDSQLETVRKELGFLDDSRMRDQRVADEFKSA
jgi:hypothetical protein